MSEKNIIVYPISANPPTLGHADIMRRAAHKFDTVFWVAAVDPDKSSYFPIDAKLAMMKDYVEHFGLTNVFVEHEGGSLVRYALKKKAKFILRGIRNTSDLHSEMDLAVGYRGVDRSIETICLFANPQLVMVSSTLVRQLATVGERVDQYLLPSVAEKVTSCIQKIKQNR